MKRSVLNVRFKTERFIGAVAAAKNRSCALGLTQLQRKNAEVFKFGDEVAMSLVHLFLSIFLHSFPSSEP